MDDKLSVSVGEKDSTVSVEEVQRLALIVARACVRGDLLEGLDAEDYAQEATTRFFEQAELIPNPGAWIGTVVSNLVRDGFRKRGARKTSNFADCSTTFEDGEQEFDHCPKLPPDLSLYGMTAEEHWADQEELSRRKEKLFVAMELAEQEAIESLTGIYKEVRDRYENGQDWNEIGAALRLSGEKARMLYYEGNKKVKKEMERRFGIRAEAVIGKGA